MSRKSSQKKRKENKRSRESGLHPHVLISGYYGFDNLGDELILKVLTDALKARKVRVTVLSRNPEKTRREYGVEAISRTSLPDIIDALAKAHLLISGGGGLFQDATGPMSALYYGGLIHLAAFFEVPVCFWAQGVGPLKRPLSRKFTASALRKCDAIVVRDEGSAALVEELTGFRPDVTADPVWLLTAGKGRHSSAPPELPIAAEVVDGSGVEKNKGKGKGKRKYAIPPSEAARPWRIGVSLRPWPALTESRLEHLAVCLQRYAASLEHPAELWLLPFQRSEDVALLTAFAERLHRQGDIPVVLREPEQAKEDVAHCRVLLGMRFHSLILALLHGVPVYGLPYDPKVASLLTTFTLQGCPVDQLDALTPDAIHGAFAHYPAINLKPLQKQAQRNLLLLDELLAIPEAELAL
jgi:polysaccharide pyruvyl transferase CsaB